MVEGKRKFEQSNNAPLMALIANCHRDCKQRSKPFEASDFIPEQDRPRRSKKNNAASLDRVFSQFPKEEKK